MKKSIQSQIEALKIEIMKSKLQGHDTGLLEWRLESLKKQIIKR